MKILIIDDNEINLNLIKEILNIFEIESVCKTNVNDALIIYQEELFDYIFMDIEMPIINGIEGFELFKKIDNNINIVAITANNSNSNIQQYLDIGFVKVLTKPFNLNNIKKFLKVDNKIE